MSIAAIQSYRDLEAWQLGMTLVEAVYALTRMLPPDEQYGLSTQLRRAAVGIPSNVAEGQQHGPGANYKRYVAVALGCEAEVQTQLELVRRLGLVAEKDVNPVLALASRTGQVMRGLQRSIRKHQARQQPPGLG